MKQMKIRYLFLSLAMPAALLIGSSAKALDIAQLSMSMIDPLSLPFSLIDWKVGDTLEYKMSVGPMSGTMVRDCPSEEGTALWTRTVVSMMGQKNVVEVLIDRNTGEIKKYRENGKEKTPPEDDMEVLDQDNQSVTVPAGTFKAIHLTVKNKDTDHMELWINMEDTSMDGTIKFTAKASGFDLKGELTKFTKN